MTMDKFIGGCIAALIITFVLVVLMFGGTFLYDFIDGGINECT